jgi:hypothetical protein
MDISHLVQHQIDWSLSTFGEGAMTERVLKHIEKEIQEVRAEPYKLEEWIDIALLALDGAWRTGATAPPQERGQMEIFTETEDEECAGVCFL